MKSKNQVEKNTPEGELAEPEQISSVRRSKRPRYIIRIGMKYLWKVNQANAPKTTDDISKAWSTPYMARAENACDILWSWGAEDAEIISAD